MRSCAGLNDMFVSVTPRLCRLSGLCLSLVRSSRSAKRRRSPGRSRMPRRRLRDDPQARAARPPWYGRPAPGPGPRAAHLPRRAAGLEAVHHRLVGRRHSRDRPRCRRHNDRRGVRGEGLAGSAAGPHREEAGPPAHGPPDSNPQRMALFDLSSSWLQGTRCPLGARGFSRDGKRENIQIEYGLLTSPMARLRSTTGAGR
jgi:hypothetical protein